MQKIDDVNYDLRKLNGQHDHLNDVVRQLAEQLASTVGVVNVYAGIHQNKGYAVVIVDRNIREPDKLIPDDVEGIPVGYRISAPVYFRAARDKLYFPNIF